MEDLVRPRAADPCDHPLVAEQRVEAPRFAGEDLAQLGRVELVRLRPEMPELELDGLGSEQPDTRALLLARLGEDQLGAALEGEPERGRLGSLLACEEVPEPPRGHQVHQQDELAVLGRKQHPLCAALGARESPPLERSQRRIERLQRRDVRGAGLRDREGRDRRVEFAPPRLHFRQFGHLESRPHG
jgi:hypothetical protein